MRHKGSGRPRGFPCHDDPFFLNTSAWLSMVILGTPECSSDGSQMQTFLVRRAWEAGSITNTHTCLHGGWGQEDELYLPGPGRRRAPGAAGIPCRSPRPPLGGPHLPQVLPALPGPRCSSAPALPGQWRGGTGPCPFQGCPKQRVPCAGVPPRGPGPARRGGRGARPGRTAQPVPLPEPPPDPARSRSAPLRPALPAPGPPPPAAAPPSPGVRPWPAGLHRQVRQRRRRKGERPWPRPLRPGAASAVEQQTEPQRWPSAARARQ